MHYLNLVVLYEENIFDSSTINSIIHAKDSLDGSKIVIWDNSLLKQSLSDVVELKSLLSNMTVEYMHNGENLALSKVYNIFRTKYNSNYEFIILMDQDSEFDSRLFITHQNIVKNDEINNLYLPVIKFKGNIVSPAHFYFFKGFQYKNNPIGKVDAKYKTAINSCMIINFNYFCNLFEGYDERLNFYGTDDDFMIKYQKLNKYFYVLDYELEHDLTFSFANDDTKKILSRYKEANSALMINNEQNKFIPSLFLRVYLKVRSLYLTLRFRDIGFLDDL